MMAWPYELWYTRLCTALNIAEYHVKLSQTIKKIILRNPGSPHSDLILNPDLRALFILSLPSFEDARDAPPIPSSAPAADDASINASFNVSPKSEEEREMEMKAGPDFSPRMSTERENWFPLSLNCTFNGQHNERSVSHLPTFNPWFSPVFCTCAQFEV